MDPRDGEISRAMRNRSVEIFVDLAWNTTECDSTSLASLSGQPIPKQVTRCLLSRRTFIFQISEALVHYPAETQLQFCILLKEMRIEEACRHLNIHFESEIESETELIPCPRLLELDSESYLKWNLNQWHPNDHDPINRAFLATLASSTKLLNYEGFRESFNKLGNCLYWVH